MFARCLTTGVALATLVALASSAGVAAASASPRSAPGRDPGYSQVVPTSDGDRGAQVPFTQYSAVNAQNTGTVIGPSDNLYTLPAEAIGRTAVTLNSAGQYVQFTLVKPANAVDLRYSIPDSADGTGLTTPLKVYVNGQARPDLTLSSTYDWFYGSYPFTNDPADLDGHHMYDDVRTLFGRTLPAGTQVRFEIADPSIPVTLNVADFEEVAPPAPQPRGSISVLSYGADPTGQTDSTTAIQNAINAGSAAGKAVYIPPGNFLVTSHLIVNNVTLTGAGEWYSVLGGNGVGVFGNFAPTPSTNVHLSNFAIYGQVNARVDSEDFMGIGGSLQDSTISDVWIQHVQAGIWMTGPFTNLKISNVRIQDTVADGINFDGGITDSSVTNTYIRNTGDDGIALWSNGVADANDIISQRHRAAAGPGEQLRHLRRQRQLHRPRLRHRHDHPGRRHPGRQPVLGRAAGRHHHHRRQHAGPGRHPRPELEVRRGRDLVLRLRRRGHDRDDQRRPQHDHRQPVRRVRLRRRLHPQRHPARLRDRQRPHQRQHRPQRRHVRVPAPVGRVGRHHLQRGLHRHRRPGRDDGLRLRHHRRPTGRATPGWSGSECTFPPFNILSTSTSSVDFGLVNLNTQSPAQTVTITNPGPDPAPISSVYATGGFAETNNCPATLAVGASCTATVTVTPTAVQQYQGNLVFDANPLNNPFAPYVVSLSAAVYNPNGNLGLTATASADNTLAGFPASNANDGNQATYWQAANATGVLTLQLAEAAPVDRVVLELPQGWGDRDQTIEVDGSTDGTTWTQLVAPTAYLFSANNAAGNNVVSIPVPSTTLNYIRVDVSNNTVQGAPQIAEFQVYSN